ncbi:MULTISPECIES: hypothetical protein [Ralstonia solanacearum species complex]|uniref:Uncharacterized protein n=2 Tax=Ralstonia solanacearum species complex TaxID=3116862 RepID=A0A0S4WZG1_RALSL|nr:MULTISPECIES: hypothetical protein [Ralstonia]QUP54453.1 hypothetical protein GO998_12185 [Ralstonia syzygii]UZF14017.1 hypothetical protein LH706_13385 [Ralstonia solanacearum]UZF29147.1 hypothetical protein LGV82_13390 [Ralstonia sp. RS650]CUV57021.1 conserved protein of unknown function [Ralstonia solanacearum]
MKAPEETHVIHRYRYLDKRTGHWKMTRHHMSQEDADQFFAPAEGKYLLADKWEPEESSRMVIQSALMHGPGINCGRRPDPGRLTVEDIRAIWERNKNPDVRRLIWEIWYLRHTVREARYVAAALEVTGIESPFQHRLDCLLLRLRAEPSPDAQPLTWFRDEEEALKRIAKARR